MISVLTTFLVKKTTFLLTFFRSKILDEGILVLFKSKPDDILFFLHILDDISTKNQYLERNSIGIDRAHWDIL